MGRMRIVCCLAAAMWLGVGSSAAAETAYGVAGGMAGAMAPTDAFGGMVGLSAMASGGGVDGPLPVLRLRGELLGIVTEDAKAIMPTLTGEIGGAVGPVELFLSGGLQIFGFAWRGEYTVFSNLGILGGGGFSVAVSPRFRLGLRGTVAWLPEVTTGRITEPESGGDTPTFAFFGVMLTLDYFPDGGQDTGRAEEENPELMPPPEL